MRRPSAAFPVWVGWSRAAIATLATALAALPAAAQHQERWYGEIIQTVSIATDEYGRRESRHVEERWTDLLVTAGAEYGFNLSIDATWSLEEARSTVDADCTSTGWATGSGIYRWFAFELDPFDELAYVLYSGGHGGGPDAAGVVTVRCRGQPPYSFDYEVPSSWLPAVRFTVAGGVLDMIPQETLDSMPPETLAMMREVDELLRQEADASVVAVRGRIDPERPNLIEGVAVGEIDGGTVTFTWQLVRPLACHDVEARERLEREADAMRGAQAGAPAELDVAPRPTGPPLAAADVRSALYGAIGAGDAVALRDGPGTDDTGIVHFGIRLSGSGQVLPTIANLRSLAASTCVGDGSLEGARTLMVGSVQWIGSDFRITVRTFDVETGVIIESSAIDGTGGKTELPGAVRGAFARFLLRS
ncbi:MAG: hypothetical protein H0U69_14455 [Trueperaceae bacterium]|nr:hypothetical protein [Trueperaceae bacterium]